MHGRSIFIEVLGTVTYIVLVFYCKTSVSETIRKRRSLKTKLH